MRPSGFRTIIQGWDTTTQDAVKIAYTGDRQKPTQSIEAPPQGTPSELEIVGAPAVTCHKCQVLKIHPMITRAVEWARYNMIPLKNRQTVPWEVVKGALAEQHDHAGSG